MWLQNVITDDKTIIDCLPHKIWARANLPLTRCLVTLNLHFHVWRVSGFGFKYWHSQDIWFNSSRTCTILYLQERLKLTPRTWDPSYFALPFLKGLQMGVDCSLMKVWISDWETLATDSSYMVNSYFSLQNYMAIFWLEYTYSL